MAQKVEENPEVYEYEPPRDKTLSGDLEQQDWRDQLFAMSAAVIIAGTGVGMHGLAHPVTAVSFLIAGLFFGVGLERYQIMKPEGGLLGQLREVIRR